ncbi:hypothetical protein IFR04_004210 [Cadophora malorum]|uniref:Uncharacterized protein n=1 Tax=Cadophora malorum TaxID=108018 RepID=A0A8H8BST9_9HELO|nr:hypothetical protein IFR04_004210 [Cadophora malorum]
MAPSHRTRTGAQTTFNLSHPAPVIYDFSYLSTDGIKITIPPKSSWICQSHWHETAAACETLLPIQGHYMIYSCFVFTLGSGYTTGPGTYPPTTEMYFRPERLVRWQRYPKADPGKAMALELKASDELYAFYRQVGTKVLGMRAQYEEYEVDVAESVLFDTKE